MSPTSITGDPELTVLPLSSMCGHLLRLAQQRHTAIWSEVIGPEPTGPQYAVLVSLETEPGIDQRRLGALASLDRSSTTDVVARLEARGWVTRASDPGDGRRDILTLGPPAAPALRDLRQRVAVVQQILLAPLAASERAALLRDFVAVARVSPREPWAAPGSALHIPGHLLRRAQQVHTSLFAEEFGRGLTSPQFAAMHVLTGNPGISQSHLGAQAGLDRSTTAELVARLERRNWLVRTRDAADGRRRALSLTEEARRTMADALPRALNVQDRLLAPMEPTARGAFLARLRPVAGLEPTAG